MSLRSWEEVKLTKPSCYINTHHLLPDKLSSCSSSSSTTQDFLLSFSTKCIRSSFLEGWRAAVTLTKNGAFRAIKPRCVRQSAEVSLHYTVWLSASRHFQKAQSVATEHLFLWLSLRFALQLSLHCIKMSPDNTRKGCNGVHDKDDDDDGDQNQWCSILTVF